MSNMAHEEQDPDELTMSYLRGVHDGKKQCTWVDLTDREMMDEINLDDSPMEMGRKIQAKLKEKNA